MSFVDATSRSDSVMHIASILLSLITLVSHFMLLLHSISYHRSLLLRDIVHFCHYIRLNNKIKTFKSGSHEGVVNV